MKGMFNMTTNETNTNDIVANPLIIESLQKNLSIVTTVSENRFDNSVKNIKVTVIEGVLAGRTYHVKIPSATEIRSGQMIKILIEKATPYAAASGQNNNSFIPIRLSLKGKILSDTGEK